MFNSFYLKDSPVIKFKKNPEKVKNKVDNIPRIKKCIIEYTIIIIEFFLEYKRKWRFYSNGIIESLSTSGNFLKYIL